MPGHDPYLDGLLDNRAARMLSADNIHPLARPLLSADNNLFQQLVESGASLASLSASPSAL
jgi:hypothetical protein